MNPPSTPSETAFKALVTRWLILNKGETQAFAIVACLGKGAWTDPETFAQRASSLLGEEGAAMVEGIAASTRQTDSK